MASSCCRFKAKFVRIGLESFPFGLSGRLQVATTISRGYSTKQESKLWQQKPNRNPKLGIILTEDMHKLGRKGQIVKVKHGYGRNYLLPQRKAVYATHYNIEKMNAYEVKKEDASSVASTEAIVNYLLGKTLCVQHDPNDSSAIFEQHISMAFYKTLYLYVPLDCIELKEPITDFDSEHSVGLHLGEETIVQVPLVVERTLTKKKQRRLEQMERFRRKRVESDAQ